MRGSGSNGVGAVGGGGAVVFVVDMVVGERTQGKILRGSEGSIMRSEAIPNRVGLADVMSALRGTGGRSEGYKPWRCLSAALYPIGYSFAIIRKHRYPKYPAQEMLVLRPTKYPIYTDRTYIQSAGYHSRVRLHSILTQRRK